jgi:hypothetical protein
MPTPTRKRATKRAPARPSPAIKQNFDDILIDRELHAPAEEIEIDLQLDENGRIEP